MCGRERKVLLSRIILSKEQGLEEKNERYSRDPVKIMHSNTYYPTLFPRGNINGAIFTSVLFIPIYEERKCHTFRGVRAHNAVVMKG